ncbi:hypothetical protein EYF80_043446 [Liparis tanakae]|uniref:Uncharacterized protein n=1 Tax=Liparis tanakae TaxID=230148 RepID=A0A4Z2FYI3_9TELE|nr:hypothetical protein EYF80_043446 [Liparis tanakae]
MGYDQRGYGQQERSLVEPALIRRPPADSGDLPTCVVNMFLNYGKPKKIKEDLTEILFKPRPPAEGDQRHPPPGGAAESSKPRSWSAAAAALKGVFSSGKSSGRPPAIHPPWNRARVRPVGEGDGGREGREERDAGRGFERGEAGRGGGETETWGGANGGTRNAVGRGDAARSEQRSRLSEALGPTPLGRRPQGPARVGEGRGGGRRTSGSIGDMSVSASVSERVVGEEWRRRRSCERRRRRMSGRRRRRVQPEREGGSRSAEPGSCSCSGVRRSRPQTSRRSRSSRGTMDEESEEEEERTERAGSRAAGLVQSDVGSSAKDTSDELSPIIEDTEEEEEEEEEESSGRGDEGRGDWGTESAA